MFIGRISEIGTLNKMYSEDRFHCAIVYGRRRVGKTYMITQFLQGRNSVYFAAEEYNHKILLDKFSAQILSKFPSQYINTFDSFEKAILYLSEQSKEQRLVLVIDEFQYWAYQNRGIISTLQNLIDHYLKESKIFLIICGSYISFMENEILVYKSPLYGRRTAQFKIEPFDFFDSALFFPQYNMEEKLLTYAVLGGIPQYLRCFSPEMSIKENIIDNLLNKNSFLYEEPYFLLKQELKEPAVYFSLIEAVAKGASKYNDISTKIGMDCGFYLNSLVELQILQKEIPVGDKKTSRKSVYKVKDNLFKFWFRFISDAKPLVEQELYEEVFNSMIEPFLSQYAGSVFEEVCIQYLKKLNGKKLLPFIFFEIGRWWGSNKIKKREEEIDILAVDNNSNALIGECKWKNEKLDMRIVKELMEKGSLLQYKSKYYVLFSKSGFSDAVITFAKEHPEIMCIELSHMA